MANLYNLSQCLNFHSTCICVKKAISISDNFLKGCLLPFPFTVNFRGCLRRNDDLSSTGMPYFHCASKLTCITIQEKDGDETDRQRSREIKRYHWNIVGRGVINFSHTKCEDGEKVKLAKHLTCMQLPGNHFRSHS